MAHPADLVRDACTLLLGYLPQAEAEIPEPSSPEAGAAGMNPRAAAAPMPGNQQALLALMAIWEAIPRTEARLRYDITGHPGQRRGGSAGNLLESLAAIPKLAGGSGSEYAAALTRWLEHLANQLRVLPGIDEAQRWRPLPSRACPRCGCWFLKVLLDAAGQPGGRIECFGHQQDGTPCRAAWAGPMEIVPELEP